ncbi:hypothetical protein ACNFIC_02870 [Pseudomonas sp. NY15463]|uniref:hypothetical protein n=1 Tax=Pseudomonas sp. NY15463 TaxID=3400361 RepID=UPI003A8B917D
MFIGYKEDQSILFDADKICYGLLKSGYLERITGWRRLRLRSIDLNPGSPSSWAEAGTAEPILGFSVEGAVAPIVFITGSGSPCGSSKVGDVTTFYYISANTNTKFYYFDTMRDSGPINGVKCFREDGVLTFNSSQRPLNIVATVTPPPPRADGRWPYQGGVRFIGSIFPGGPVNVINRVGVSLGTSEEYAAYVNFTRTAAVGPVDGSYFFLSAVQEGAYGVVGGVEFMFCIAARSTELDQSRVANEDFNRWRDIPTSRYPKALVIRTRDYPFPYN